MAELFHIFRTGLAVFKRTMQGRIVYANYFLLDLVAFFISFGMTMLLWLYVSDHKPGGLGISREGLIAYLSLALAVNFAKSIWIDNILGGRIRTGQVATDLLKPMNFQWLYFFSSMADVAIQFVMAAALLVIAWAFLPEAPLKLEPARLAVFALSRFLGVLVQYGICFFFTLGAFFTNFGYGIFFTRLMLHQAFSGIFAPLLLYPDSLRHAAEWMPFQCVVHTPVVIGLGWLPLEQAPALLLQQALWAVGLLALGQWAFNRIASTISIQGG